MKEVNSMYFEDLKEAMNFVEVLCKSSLSENSRLYNDIHIYPEEYSFIVEWIQKPYDNSYGGRFKYIPEGGEIFVEYEFPDNHYGYYMNEEDYEDALMEWLNKNPGWERNQYGHWYNTIEEAQLREEFGCKGKIMESMNDVTRFGTSLLNLNVPTINGRVYTREAVQKALDDASVKEKLEVGLFPVVYNDGTEPCVDNYGNIDLRKVVGKVDRLVLTNDDKLYAYGIVFNPDMEKRFTKLEFTPLGCGDLTSDIQGNAIVSNYKLLGVGVSLKEE